MRVHTHQEVPSAGDIGYQRQKAPGCPGRSTNRDALAARAARARFEWSACDIGRSTAGSGGLRAGSLKFRGEVRLATVPIEEGAHAGGPVSVRCEPAAAAAPEPLPGGPGLPVRVDPGRATMGLRDLRAVVGRRRAPVRRWSECEPLATICAESGCSRASLFRSRTRFERDGLEGLLDRPRVGRRSDLPPTIERLIFIVRPLACRNSQRIAAAFRRRGVWPLMRSTSGSKSLRFVGRPPNEAEATPSPAPPPGVAGFGFGELGRPTRSPQSPIRPVPAWPCRCTRRRSRRP
jgi:hypothetical protein